MAPTATTLRAACAAAWALKRALLAAVEPATHGSRHPRACINARCPPERTQHPPSHPVHQPHSHTQAPLRRHLRGGAGRARARAAARLRRQVARGVRCGDHARGERVACHRHEQVASCVMECGMASARSRTTRNATLSVVRGAFFLLYCIPVFNRVRLK